MCLIILLYNFNIKIIIANNILILCKQCVKIKQIKQGKGQNEQLIRSKNYKEVF